MDDVQGAFGQVRLLPTDPASPRLPYPIVDSHHHLWDLKSGSYPSKNGPYDPNFFLGDYHKIRKDYLPADYLRDWEGYRLIGSVHIQAGRANSEQIAETEWVEGIGRNCGLPTVMVGHVVFTQPDREEILRAHTRSPLMRGIRSRPATSRGPGQSVRGQPGTMQDDDWLAGFALLEKFGLSWDLRVPYWHLEEAAAVARAFPRTPINICHTGLPLDRSEEGLAIWRKGLDALASCDNVVMKISELGLPRNRWDVPSNIKVIREGAAIFGFDRIMFGSNMPVGSVCTDIPQMLDTYSQALSDATPEQLEKFYSKNCIRFYRMPI